ncbi:hypothetical protein ACSBR2_017274 [Camellia fascicularis]
MKRIVDESYRKPRGRVEVDVSKPFPLGFVLINNPSQNGKETWVQYKFGKLGDFCYDCGRIGYDNSSCRAPKLNMSIAQVQYWVDEVEAHLKAFAKMRALLARRKEVCMGANSPSPGTEQTRMVIPTVSSVKISIVSGDRVSPPKTGEVHPLRKTGTCGKVDAPSGAVVGHLSESTNLEKNVLHGPPFNGPGAGVGPRYSYFVTESTKSISLFIEAQSVLNSCGPGLEIGMERYVLVLAHLI